MISALIIILPFCSHGAGTVSTPTEAALNSALLGGGTVTIACNGTITLTNVEIITTNTVVDATGYTVTISGGNSVQIFSVSNGVSLTLSNLTITDGFTTTNGGAIYNSGSLSAYNCAFTYNNAIGVNGANGANGGNGSNNGGAGQAGGSGVSVHGGAIYNLGTLTLTACLFQDNVVVGGTGGNGGNGGSGLSQGGAGGTGGAGGFAKGGAIFSTNNVAAINCSFNFNSAFAGNGGAGGQTGAGGSSGAMPAGGAGGEGSGGGLYAYLNSTVTGSTFWNNTATGGNGGTEGTGYGYDVQGVSGGGSRGGGLCNIGTNIIVNCTFSTNTVTGGNGANMINEYTEGGNGGNGSGGGLYSSTNCAITNCTFSSCGAYGGSGGTGFFYGNGNGGSGSGGNFYRSAGTVTLKNSIFAYALSGGNGSGTITDAGNNISSDGSISLTSTNSHSNTNPLLFSLASNGGYTMTCALQSNSPAVNAGNDSAAPPTDQRGYFRVGTSDIGAFEYGGGTFFVETLGPTASLDGNVGLFLIGGLTQPASAPFTVNFVMSGTASNGVDYVYITNSATIQTGSEYARVLVNGMPGAFGGITKSATLTLISGTNYTIIPGNGLYPNTGTIDIFDHNTYDPTKRYVRGTSTAPDFQSFVVPIDFETGVPLNDIGGNATNLFPGNVWTNTLYHFNATNLVSQTNITGRIPFQNPIVAFGDTVGGSPLYLNRSYNFGIASGYPTTLSNALHIQVYYRSNSAYAGTIAMPIPNVTNTNQLTGLVTNGFTQTFIGFGLQTTMLMPSYIGWGLQFGQNFILTHTASAAATNYYYVIEEQGFAPGANLVLNQSGTNDWSKLYVMEFSPFPANRSTFIDQPHFDGVPMPSTYQGMSLQELTNVQATLPNLSNLTPSNYLTLDASPELRRYPILDQFVKNMGNDPLALANYVINEIGLVDAVDYNTNYSSQAVINLGGVNRSALDTFQEGQGSPIEQCALLVYLLRQAGVPATYVFPTNGGLQMLNSQVSKLLHVQLQGAVNYLGQTNVPTLINVNYPWVAAYVGTNWVQIFPWMKDTEITEGFDLYDYMPTNYNSGYKWLTHFIAGDTNIFSLSSSDQPLVLLPLFIQNSLNQNYPGMSVSDLGIQIVNRRHLYSQWSDFPTPFALSGTPTIIESLSTNLNLFNTLEIQVYSQANPNKFIDTTEMLVADLHNRMLLLKFQQVGTNNVHNMILSLESYSTNYTNVTVFGTNANPCWKLVTTNQLNSSDDTIVYQITHRSSRFLPANFTAPADTLTTNLLDYNYFEAGQQLGARTFQEVDTFRKGDLVAFCFDVGRVSQNMLNVHAQQIWQFNQNANTNLPATIDPDIYLGETTYLMGMSYFNYNDQFQSLNSQLHKVNVVSWYQEGYGLLRPQRDSTGALINGGNVIPITPAVHMPYNGGATIFNVSSNPNSGRDPYSAGLDWFFQSGVQGSAAEHGVLRSFYATNAISTVKLLQQAGTNTVKLNVGNYLAAGTVSYHGVQLENADANAWADVVNFFNSGDTNSEVFMTPGIVTNGTYVGVGTLLISRGEIEALVSGLDGGFANSFSTTTFSSQNSVNLTVNPAPDNSVTPFYLTTTSDNNNSGYLVDGATATWQQSATDTSLANGQTQLDPALSASLASLQAMYGSQVNSASAYNQLYNVGAASTETPTYNDWTQRISDPVNLMTGEFYVDAPDITLPGPMPLQIRRNYGSQNLAENEFGFGWKMSDVPYLSVGTNSILIYAAEMDGTVVAYRQTSNTNIWLPQPQDNPTLNNNSSIGIGSVGNLFNNRLQLSVVSGTNTYILAGADGSIRTFTQQSFPVGTFTRQRPYLNTWQDNKGNSYTFQYGNNSTQPDYGEVNRIQSSNGNFVGFYYDVYGHIIQAYTGDGRWLQYVYDQYGDLVSVTLPDQMEIDYLYQHSNYVTNGVTNIYSTHLIVEEDKPDGRVLQNIYDSQRRVTNQLSTAGVSLTPIRTATFAYTNNFSLSSPTNLLTGTTMISDYFNHATTYYYTNSLVRKIIDPLNQTIVQNWYETNTISGFQRSLKSVTDKRGLQTAYLYDAYGNLTNTVTTGDLTGNGITTQTATNSASYNTNNLPVQITDPIGNSTVVVYDPTFTFQPQQTIRYAGTTPVSTNFMLYGDATNIVVDGSLTQTNTALGLLTRQIRAYGSPDAATNDLFYNGQGFVTNSVKYTGTGDPNVVNQLFYDERGELVQRTDAVGANYVFAFDPMGRKTAQETYDAGQTVPMDFDYWYYNDNGELNWIDGPRYNPEDYIFYDYDGAGRVTTEIHWRSEANNTGTGVEAPAGYNVYAQTFNQFDPLGNLLSKTDPRGAVTTNAWDALCRLTQSTHLDINGVTVLSREGFGYEPGGQVQSHTNALGGVTTTLYTTTGKPEFRSNPDGSTNAWLYYLDGRTYREIQSNGAYWQTTYDDVNRITTRIFYSAAGVPEATNSVQLDRRGNAIQRVDAGGNVFTATYDGLDRTKIAAGPAILTVIASSGSGMGFSTNVTYVTNVLQQTFTNFYDAAGRALTNANTLGEKTVTFLDAIGRTIQTEIFSASGALVRQTSTAYSADHNSVTTTSGSGASAVVNTTYTDNDGHTVLSIAYPASGVNEFTLNQYDLAGNLVSAQHDSSASGTVTTWTMASLAYDGLNRQTSKSDRDNALTTYAYDPMSDLTNRTMPGGLQWQATYNNAGQLLQEQNVGGANATRTNTYSYFSSGNTFAGLLQTKTDGRGVSCTYAYDDWLRPTNMAYSGSLPEQNLTTVWQYEPRGFVTGITEQFASTNTGPATSIQRSYDPYGQLASESVSAGSFGYGASQSFDAAGRRSQLGIGGGSYGFGWQADGNLISASDSTGSGAYAYDTAGILTSRTVGNRYTSISSRDGEGRPLSIATTVNTLSELTESLTWSGDGLLTADTLARADFTDSRAYAYASLSRRLVQEQLNLNGSTTWTNTMAYDNGVAAGPGVLTQMGKANGTANLWNGVADAFSRVATETNNTFQYPAYGHVNGQSTLYAWLDNQPISVTAMGTNAMQWRAPMELSPGTHQLTVAALHPSGFYTAWATNSFTNSIAYQATVDSYDSAGDITNRVWRSPNGTVDRTQTLFWDARGRLHTVTERDGSNSGYNWTAAYDALNRRLATTTVLVTNGVASTAPPETINSYYDPQVEFLELGISYGITTEWKLYGPDLTGKYGGMNGTGGLDAISPYLDLFNPVISDARGNVLAEVTNGVTVWNPSRPTGYGAVPGYRPVALDNGADIAQSSAWRGREMDLTGYIQLGLRPYDPISGRWLTYDSVWNERDPNYYSFCGGNPVGYFDSDGRLTSGFYNGTENLIGGAASLIYNAAGATEYALASTVAPNWAYQNLGGYAQNFASQVTGAAQTTYDVAALATYGLVSPFAPDYAYNNYGGNVQQLLGQAPAFVGGNNQSTAYQIGYGTVSAATMLFGGEEVEAGNLGTAGNVSDTMAAASGGTANLYYYSAESLGQDLPHFSVETFGENGMNTHQVITGPDSTTVVPVQGLPTPTAIISVPLADPAAAQAMQAQQLGANLGTYCPRNNSCLTTAADVLRAGGADVPAGNVQLRTWVKNQIQQ